jgi:NTP pyrophosphatase (non-canonical NTP hydrolase)
MGQINRLQREVNPWTFHNWGDLQKCPPVVAVVGVGEETGELQRAVLKQHQQIRGTFEEWQEEIEKECGDVFLKLCDIAVRCGFDLGEAIENRWLTIQQRDWQKDKIGHGIDKA